MKRTSLAIFCGVWMWFVLTIAFSLSFAILPFLDVKDPCCVNAPGFLKSIPSWVISTILWVGLNIVPFSIGAIASNFTTLLFARAKPIKSPEQLSRDLPIKGFPLKLALLTSIAAISMPVLVSYPIGLHDFPWLKASMKIVTLSVLGACFFLALWLLEKRRNSRKKGGE